MKSMGSTYKIKEYSGCMADGIEVNGKDFYFLPIELQADICDKVYNKISVADKEEYKDSIKENGYDLRYLLQFIEYDDSDCESEPCDQCGDTVSWKIYNV